MASPSRRRTLSNIAQSLTTRRNWNRSGPHLERTALLCHSPELIAELFAGVPDDERGAILGGTLGGILGFERIPAAA
jgi:hypothetical protein